MINHARNRIAFRRDATTGAGYWIALHGVLGVWIGPGPAYKTAEAAYRAAASCANYRQSKESSYAQ